MKTFAHLLTWLSYFFTQLRTHARHGLKNTIHPTAYIHPHAELGRGNYIGPYCHIGARVSMGNGNHLESHVCVGTQPEHTTYWSRGKDTVDKKTVQQVFIGNNNVLREFVTVQGGTKNITMIGSDCRFLRGSHVSHDTVIENRVNISCNVLIGGESLVMKGANIGLGAVIHQQHIVGSYAMIGMGTIVPKKVELRPGIIYVGNPAKELRENTVGLQRDGIGYDKMRDLARRYEEAKEARA